MNNLFDFICQHFEDVSNLRGIRTDEGLLRAYLSANSFGYITSHQLDDLMYNIRVGLVDVRASSILPYGFPDSAHNTPQSPSSVLRYNVMERTTHPILVGQISYWMSKRLLGFDSSVPFFVSEGGLLGWDGEWMQYAVAIGTNPTNTYFVEIGRGKNLLEDDNNTVGIPAEYYPMERW